MVVLVLLEVFGIGVWAWVILSRQRPAQPDPGVLQLDKNGVRLLPLAVC